MCACGCGQGRVENGPRIKLSEATYISSIYTLKLHKGLAKTDSSPIFIHARGGGFVNCKTKHRPRNHGISFLDFYESSYRSNKLDFICELYSPDGWEMESLNDTIYSQLYVIAYT